MSMRLALAIVLFAAAGAAQDFGPDTCISGFVWREAFAGDHVCVSPEVRAQAAEDNRAAQARRAPGGGPYGPDTCRPGFVWREARPEDHVCVMPPVRTQAASDNAAASGRFVRTQAPARGRTIRSAEILRPTVLRPSVPSLQPPPPRSGSPLMRGFDENGEPYVQEKLPDGSLRREQRNGVTVIHPDGTSQFFPNQVMRANAQPPTPPELPSDPARGRAWMSLHNEQLLDLIRTLVNNDDAQMQTFNAAEAKTAGADLFKQVEFRTRTLEVLAR